MFKKTHISPLLIALCTVAFSQNAPVSTTTTVLPPFSIHMFENLRSDRDKFIVTVTLRDLTQTEGQVRLRLRMESFTHAMQTRRGAQTPIHTLIPGVPLRLTNEDLRVYFLEQNLEFTNMPRNLYRNNATVPEGHYRIWFEVYEARTGAHVSRGSEVAANLHIVQHDVPLINLPQQNATVHLPESGLQHVVFQWAPRHFGPGMLTEYRLQIVEVPPGMNPEQVMHATLVPFFETTTMATSFVFNHTHPPMRLGFTYAFRVQARLRGPDEGMSMFNNNGFTPTQWFTFSQRCPELRNVRVEPINQFAVWVHYMDHPLYERVRFRRRLDQAGSFWHYITGTQNPLLVTELRPEQGYQYQMMAYCAFEYSNWTPIRTFTTPPAPPPLFECGAEDTTPPLVNTGVPLGRPLRRGDVVRLPQNSELVIRESTGTGPFRGYGTVFFNFFNANLIMTFEALEVDDEMQWVSGELISRSSRDNRFMFNIDDVVHGGGGVGRVITGETTTEHQTNNELSENSTVTYNPNTGNLTIIAEDGTTTTIPNVESLPTTIVDGSGALFTVNEQGEITQIGQRLPNPENPPRTMQPAVTGSVTFARHTDSRFAFDQWNEVYATSILIREVYPDLNGYRPPFKAIPQGKSGKVIATMNLRDSRINPDSVRFITPQGVSFTPRRISQNTYELTLLGGRENDAQEVFAVYEIDGEMITLGKINVVTYRLKSPRVVLVPVNGATIDVDAIARKLDQIYGPLGISWQVSKANNFEFDGDTDFFERRSGLFAAYTPTMRYFQSVFLEYLGDDFDSEAAYLFIFDELQPDRDQSGFMPRGEQMGYIFSRGMSAETLGIIIAHELAHGVFQLRHTFDNAYGLAKNALPYNLMDYSLGTHLAKWQWDLMFSPGIVMRIFERDEDAMFIRGPGYRVAATVLTRYLRSLGGTAEMTRERGSGSARVQGTVSFNAILLSVDKTFRADGDLTKYGNFLSSMNLSPYGAYLATLEGWDRFVMDIRRMEENIFERGRIERAAIYLGNMISTYPLGLGPMTWINLIRGEHYATGQPFGVRDVVRSFMVSIAGGLIGGAGLGGELAGAGVNIILEEVERFHNDMNSVSENAPSFIRTIANDHLPRIFLESHQDFFRSRGIDFARIVVSIDAVAYLIDGTPWAVRRASVDNFGFSFDNFILRNPEATIEEVFYFMNRTLNIRGLAIYYVVD